MEEQGNEKFVLWAIRVPIDFLEKMRVIKKETHISISEQVRTALRDYFTKLGR